MRLLTLPLRLPFMVVRGALSLLGDARGPQATPVRQPPQPRYAPSSPPPPAPPTPEPAHVSEEPELVAEVADSGVEEGAGAELHIDEPWDGYDGLTANEIRNRLRVEGPEAATAVRLYEAANKGRSSVLEAATRELNGRPSG